jgi:hypothetical protein
MGCSDTTFHVVARLLPREFRERVFEPALVDLQLEEADPARRSSRTLARVVLVAECLRLGVPQYFWYRRRPTRLTMGLVAVFVAAMIVVQRLDYGKR